MKRHLTDRPSSRDDGLRLARFLRVERLGRIHPSIAAMRRKPRARSALGSKVLRYVRLDREQVKSDP